MRAKLTVSTANWPINIVDTATSSSDLVRGAAAAGAPEGTGFLVGVQSAGRGRRGRFWASEQGGMYYSVLLTPSFPSTLWFGISFIACLAIRDVIAGYVVDQKIGLKWPNDVVVAGRGKICGILIEVTGDNLIVGTGVNIAPVAPLNGAVLPPVALNDVCKTRVTPQMLAVDYRTQLARRYAVYAESGFAPVRSEWLSHCVHRHQEMTVHCTTRAISGVFNDLGLDGSLTLLADDGVTHHISTGEVELMGQSNAFGG